MSLYYLKPAASQVWELRALALHTLKFSFCRTLISLTSFLRVSQCRRGEIPSGQEEHIGVACKGNAACTKECERSRCASFTVASPAYIAPLAERIAFFREVARSKKKKKKLNTDLSEARSLGFPVSPDPV